MSICISRVHLGLGEVAFIEGCPHVRGGLYDWFHCIFNVIDMAIFPEVANQISLSVATLASCQIFHEVVGHVTK